MNYMSLSSLVLSEHLEDYLQSTARDGIQALIAALYTLPIHPSPDGPLAQLPPPTTALPRAKPLPKPKAPTKWERFAASKGIQKKRRERKVWDEEKQEWVDRWGRDGKNKDKEVQWIHEVKADAGGVLPCFVVGTLLIHPQPWTSTRPRMPEPHAKLASLKTNANDFKTSHALKPPTKPANNAMSTSTAHWPRRGSVPPVWASLTRPSRGIKRCGASNERCGFLAWATFFLVLRVILV